MFYTTCRANISELLKTSTTSAEDNRVIRIHNAVHSVHYRFKQRVDIT